MTRRTILRASAAGVLLAAAPSLAQHPARAKRLPVIGLLYPNPTPPPAQRKNNPMFAKLRERGWIDGETVTFENASGEGREDRLPALAEDLVRKRVDVIWAAGPEAAIAAARATKEIPIVFHGVGFPVELGLVQSLARPGRNVTGLAYSAGPEVETKQLELLREIAPRTRRVSYLAVPTSRRALSGEILRAPERVLDDAARDLGFEFQRHALERREDLDGAFAAVLASRAEALMVQGHPVFIRDRQRIAGFATGNRLASASPFWEFVEAGGLVSYGVDRLSAMAQSFQHVDRILRGANPAQLPVELPSRYTLVINIKTAKLLALAVPPSVLLRADRVIE